MLDAIAGRLSAVTELQKYPELCVYAGGAFGRREANIHSGPDLLLLSTGNRQSNRIPRLSQTLIDAALINVVKDLGLPSFSNDGEFLHVHYLENMLDNTGSPEDDRSGALHARMTLLLESAPVHNEKIYQQLIGSILHSYCEDFRPYERPSSPAFLLNDILRYWKGLQVNYLYQRHVNADDPYNHLCNLKLIFCKKIACYSLILPVLALHHHFTEDLLVKLVRKSPMERFERLPQLHAATTGPVAAITNIYSNFLELNEQPFQALMEQLREPRKREEWYTAGDHLLNGHLCRLFRELGAAAPDAIAQLLF